MPTGSYGDNSSVLGAELERVDTKVPTLFERDDTTYAMIEKRNVEMISSRDMRIPLELRPGGDFGAYDPDGGDLGRGTAPFLDKATIGAVHFKIGFEWTYQAQISTDDKRKAVVDAFRHYLAKAMPEFRRQVNSSVFTNGTGVLATPNAVTVAGAADGGDLWTVPVTDGFGVRLLRYGQKVGIYDTTLAIKRGEARVTFYDYENRQVGTFPSIAAAAATDKLVVSGLTAPPTWLFGIPYHHSNASTGTWLGFQRNVTPEIRANRVNAGGALALPFPRLALNKVGNRVGKNFLLKVVALMHEAQQAAYEEMGQLVSVIHKQPKDEALDLYFNDSMQMAGAPVKTDFSQDKTRIDFLLADVWGRAELKPAGFYEVDGKRIWPVRGASGGLAAAMLFYLVAHFNLFVNNPAACAYIDGLTIPSGY